MFFKLFIIKSKVLGISLYLNSNTINEDILCKNTLVIIYFPFKTSMFINKCNFKFPFAPHKFRFKVIFNHKEINGDL